MACPFDVDLEGFEDASGDAVPFTQESEKNVFRADVRVVQGLGFFAGQGEHLFDSGCIGNVAGDLGVRASSNLLFDLHPHGF